MTSGTLFLFSTQKNGSAADGVFTISTGAKSMSNYAAIDNWNGMTKLPFWQADKCNRIVGTDGTAYPPDLTPNTTIHMFNPELCRSLPLVYHKDVVHNGVAGQLLFLFSTASFLKKHRQGKLLCVALACVGFLHLICL